MKRRRPFTLLEVLVAAMLASALFVGVTQLYYLLERSASKARDLRAELSQQRYLQYRLHYLFSRVVDKVTEKANPQPFFSSHTGEPAVKGESLVFVTDRGVDFPPFAGPVLARLYRDKADRLMVAYWPLPDEWDSPDPLPMEQEMLMEGVTALSFRFFSPPTDDQRSVGGEDPVNEGRSEVTPPPDVWLDQWDIRYKGLPPLVEVIVERNDHKARYQSLVPAGIGKMVVAL